MTPVSQDARSAAVQVLELLQVRDLEGLRERAKMLSIKESVDLMIPAVSALSSADDDAQRELQPAVGVALYQCLIRERLAGPSMDVVVGQVMAGEHKKPRELDKTIPRALEAAITRATRKHAEERFASMRELGAALLPFASKEVQQLHGADFPKPGSKVEAVLLRRLEQGEDLKLLAAALAVALPFVVATRQSEAKPAPAPSAEQTNPSGAARATAEGASAEKQAAATRATEHEDPAPEAEVEKAVPHAASAGTAPDEAPAAEARSTYPIDVAVQPSTAWIMLDNKPAGRGRLRRELPRDGTAHALHVGAPGYRVQALHFKDAPPAASVVLAKRAR